MSEREISLPQDSRLEDLSRRALSPFWITAYKRSTRLIRTQPAGVFGALVLALFVVMALGAPLIAPYSPTKVGVGIRLVGPSGDHLMGTDSIGRDVFSRIVYGSRLSLKIGFGAVFVGVTIGTLVGIASGYFSGLFDILVQRLVDALSAIPGLILALVVVTVLGSSQRNLIGSISLLMIPGTARIIRSAVLSERENQYIEAARVLGASHSRIMFRHVLPNVAAPLIVIVSILVGVAILVEASLGFLGLGVPPPTPSWGQMLAEGRPVMLQQPWLAVWPGLAISSIVLGMNLLGDSMRDVLDPKQRIR